MAYKRIPEAEKERRRATCWVIRAWRKLDPDIELSIDVSLNAGEISLLHPDYLAFERRLYA